MTQVPVELPLHLVVTKHQLFRMNCMTSRNWLDAENGGNTIGTKSACWGADMLIWLSIVFWEVASAKCSLMSRTALRSKLLETLVSRILLLMLKNSTWLICLSSILHLVKLPLQMFSWRFYRCICWWSRRRMGPWCQILSRQWKQNGWSNSST
jgi:hypothetical protein